MTIEVATTNEQIAACFPVMRELRPHLEPSAFVPTIRQLERDGYRLAWLEADGAIVTVAGFRLKRALFCPMFLYVDDLVTLASERSKGYGRIMLDWLKERARQEGCLQLHLDSGMHRTDAHRFHERERLHRSGYHFRADMTEP
jgi:GNAT superfamily N-acetyltransferase